MVRNGSESEGDGNSRMPSPIQALMPTSLAARPTSSSKKYPSQNEVVPVLVISQAARRDPIYTNSLSTNFASAGKI